MNVFQAQVDVTALFLSKEINFVTTAPSDLTALHCGMPHTSSKFSATDMKAQRNSWVMKAFQQIWGKSGCTR